MDVYIDVLIFDNMLLNMTILLSVAGYMRERKNIMFIILSSAIGTAYSILMVFFENSKVIFNWPMKMILSFVMVIVAFRPKTIKSFLRVLLCFYVVTFVFAGLAIAIIFMWGQTLVKFYVGTDLK